MNEPNQPYTDVLILGGGLGGVAAALAAVEGGAAVVLVEGDRWLGGQLTAQAVPPDEHMWSEQFGLTASYRRLRDGIRRYYRDNFPLTAAARAQQFLNPGGGFVSPICHEPRVAVAVIEAMLAPWRASGRLTVLQPYRLVSAQTAGDLVRAVTILSETTGDTVVVEARYVLDATETGELLPAAGVEYVTGFDPNSDTGEPHAPEVASRSISRASRGASRWTTSTATTPSTGRACTTTGGRRDRPAGPVRC